MIWGTPYVLEGTDAANPHDARFFGGKQISKMFVKRIVSEGVV